MTGRTKTTEEEYQRWLEDMRPFLMQGYSLNLAIEKAYLTNHRTSVYEKYAQKDWFSDKIDYFQSTVGELANNIVYKVISGAHQKFLTNSNYSLTKEEVRILILVATKHKASQPFFVTRMETARAGRFENIAEVPKISYILPEGTKEV
jgi:hypothetical protein